MSFELVNPAPLGPPRGFNHGLLAPPGARLLFVAGQVGIAPGPPPPDFVAQFDAALANVLAVVREAGGEPADVARLTVFVTDMAAYRASGKPLGERWRTRMGRHYPAMSLVEVRSLVEPAALVEIEATAVLAATRPTP